MSSSSKALSGDQLAELYGWLEKSKFSIEQHHAHHNFADGRLFARLLKVLHPKLVNMAIYPPRCSVLGKADNWVVLNIQVMHRLGLDLSQDMIGRLARGERGAMEMLLYTIMQYELAAAKDKQQSQDSLQLPEGLDWLSKATVAKVPRVEGGIHASREFGGRQSMHAAQAKNVKTRKSYVPAKLPKLSKKSLKKKTKQPTKSSEEGPAKANQTKAANQSKQTKTVEIVENPASNSVQEQQQEEPQDKPLISALKKQENEQQELKPKSNSSATKMRSSPKKEQSAKKAESEISKSNVDNEKTESELNSKAQDQDLKQEGGGEQVAVETSNESRADKQNKEGEVENKPQ